MLTEKQSTISTAKDVHALHVVLNGDSIEYFDNESAEDNTDAA